MSTPIVYVNAELVAQAGGGDAPFPADWDGLIGLAHRIDGLGPDIDGMYYGLGVDDWTTQALILNQGGSLLTPDETDIAFDGPQGIEALRLFRRFRAEGGQPAIGDESARQQFVAGKLGILIASTSGVRGLETDIGGRFPLDDGSAAARRSRAWPPADRRHGGRDPDGRSREACRGLGVSTVRDRPRGADPDGAEVRLHPGHEPGARPGPSRRFLSRAPELVDGVEQIPVSVPWTAWPGPNGVEIAQALLDAMSALAQDRLTPDEALARMASDARRLISRR